MELVLRTKHHLWQKLGSQETSITDIPTAPFCDSNAAIGVPYKPKVNNRARYIDVEFHIPREEIKQWNSSHIAVYCEGNFLDIQRKRLMRYVSDNYVQRYLNQSEKVY
jgi:hypothetical protein